MSCTEQCRKPVGQRECHCGACHLTFTGITWFDLHRIGGNCHPVEGLVEKNGLMATKEAHARALQSAAILARLRGISIDKAISDEML